MHEFTSWKRHLMQRNNPRFQLAHRGPLLSQSTQYLLSSSWEKIVLIKHLAPYTKFTFSISLSMACKRSCVAFSRSFSILDCRLDIIWEAWAGSEKVGGCSRRVRQQLQIGCTGRVRRWQVLPLLRTEHWTGAPTR